MVEIQQRKLKHVEACLHYPVEYERLSTGFEKLHLPYQALPETSLADIDMGTEFLGKRLRAPFLIGAMTGGADLSATINKNLAIAAQHLGVGLMLGSQRVMLENPKARASFEVRDVAPDVLLIGNLGVAQLNKGYGAQEVHAAMDLIAADALAFHTNPLQEAMQQRGDTNFHDLIAKLKRLVPEVEKPLMLKEVGHGLSSEIGLRLKDAGFAAFDVAGAGGTSWAKVEDYVSYGKLLHADLAEWGIPTAEALKQLRQVLPDTPLVASGGIRSGLDAAKALAMGARVVAVARPLLEPAIQSAEAVVAWIENFLWELSVAMFASGISCVQDISSLELRASV